MQFNFRSQLSHIVLVSAACAALAACSGSNGSSYNPPSGGYGNGGYGYGNACDPGTNVQLANPTENSTGVSTNTGSITIVANGNSNALYQNYANFSIVLQGNYGPIYGGPLSLVSDPQGPHPFPSDYFYSSSFSGLPGGQYFTVLLVANTSNCNGVTIGNFST